ncbi:YceI family protein [Actinokineospora sp. G85]|uniref:YceI family protein n=1 Tax=Actinokineospora sp. G85 TaxID=3406626 RepID=UPI003C78B4F6
MTIQIPPPGEYRVDPAASTVAFSTRHFFGLGAVKGTFTVVEGAITVADPPTASTVRVVIAADSVNTANPTRDKMVVSKTYLDAANHPTITFVADSVSPPAVQGDLTVRGTSASVTLTVESAETEGENLTLNATTEIDRYDFGVKAMPGMTGRKLAFTLDVVARKVSG